MNRPGTRRRGRLARRQVVSFLFLSAVLHGALLLLVPREPVPSMPVVAATPPPRPDEQALQLDVSCAVDAVLAAGARVAWAASPFARDRGAAWRVAGRDLRMELVGCYTAPEQPQVALLTPAQARAIEPVPLLPTMPLEDAPPEKQPEKQPEEQPEEQPQQVEQPPQELERMDRSAQVVELTPPKVEERPDQARFVAEFDSRAAREVVARGSTEKMVEKPDPAHLPPSDRPTPPTQEPVASRTEARPNSSVAVEPPDDARSDTPQRAERPGDGKTPGALAMRDTASQSQSTDSRAPGSERGPPAEASAQGILPRRGAGGAGTRSLKEDLLMPPRGEGGQGGAPAEREVPNLRPSEELLSRAVGGGSVDHLEGVDDGDTTALNARRWKFATFFNRVKRQVAQNWHPDKIYLQRDPQGNVYGFKDRVTEVRVSLHLDGTLAQIHILRPSGVDFLDEEALRAFQAAQPFPNPPRGLVDEASRLITFKFGFHFMIGGRPGAWRVYREY